MIKTLILSSRPSGSRRLVCLLGLLGSIALTACQSVGDGTNQTLQSFNDGMKKIADAAQGITPNYTVRGRLLLRDGSTLTCFVGINAGYAGPANLAAPAQAVTDARTGQITVRTAAIPIMIMTADGVVTNNDCDQLVSQGMLVMAAGSGTSVAGGLAGANPASTGKYQTFATSDLVKFFEQHPQPGAGKTTTWPRVAITLLEEPPWGNQEKSQLNNFRPPSPGCWTFKAKIWESNKSSRDTKHFQYCTNASLLIPGGDNFAYYLVWSGLGVGGEKPGSTGTRRTDGPNFPDNPLPVNKRSSRARLNPVTFTGEVISGIMYGTGIDMSKPDPRLWLNFGPALDKDLP